MVEKTPRSVTSPKKFIVGMGLLSQLHDFVNDFGDNAFIISDEFIVERVKKECLPGLEKAGLKGAAEKFNYECTDEEIKRLGELAGQQKANVIVGVGGGKTLDTAKAVAHYYKMPVLLYPTIASSDAPCTALAVVYTKDGAFDRYLFLPQNPDAVIADTSILAGAPVRFFAAGVGDALSTYFEARACFNSDGINLMNKKPSRTGLGIAKMCYDLLRENVVEAMDAVRNKVSTRAVEEVVEATIYLSGIGAETGGLAAAHAIHNGMTEIEDLHHAQHGEKVVFGLLTQLVLEKAPREEIDDVVRVLKAASLPMTLKEIGLKEFVEADWRKVAELACAKDDTMSNMPFAVTPEDVYNAIVAANAMAERYRAEG
ncbi:MULTISPECIES: glycerol dehydrogenase [unclassified Saccharibacter]|uniref:glycerol dehydrogenase n=1 Tax=unclassified Saccharibacter TaxID=2648722 RepID=UPI001323B133|nr:MULTISPECIES: glycerol dehydrogenase [unclassified Saccharibacter]MXV35184.1 iron-containing alcohol dehydrogenase [Saccharibacter sp. EH611]MXV57269.1 iron-containing alcohol dehydrogenase [Saccharibacter sp. EH70]MXV64870.1 iron-containing alcohol dehydrogenase [Saccharibacter sp. EH60]